MLLEDEQVVETPLLAGGPVPTVSMTVSVVAIRSRPTCSSTENWLSSQPSTLHGN